MCECVLEVWWFSYLEKGVSDVVREGFLEDTLWKPENGWDVGRRRK